jgi:protein-S-isoprenylcysteine O-methyltransferase Ste14
MFMPNLKHDQVVAAINDAWLVLLLIWSIGMFAVKEIRLAQDRLSLVAYSILLIATFWVLFDPQLLGGEMWIPHRRSSTLLGASLFVIGFLVALWARLALGKNWSAEVALKHEHTLVESGPYRMVRHPMYTGMTLSFLGTAVVSGAAPSLLATGAFLLLHVWKLRREEALLIRQFPESYPSYRSRTRALVPFVF